MDLFAHFRVIYRRRWLVLVTSLAVGALVGAWSSIHSPVYRASSLISVTSGRAIAGETVTSDDTVFLARTYAELALTRPVLVAAASRSGLPITPGEAHSRVSASAATDVGYLTISATGPSPAAATALDQAAADALLAAVADQQQQAITGALAPIQDEVDRLAAQLAQTPAGSPDRGPLEARYAAVVQAATNRRLAPIDRLLVTSPARAEAGPVAPTPRRDALLAFLVALVVNSELAVALEGLRDRFSAEEQGEGTTELMGLPVLARVPSGGPDETLEAFRTLRTNLMFLETDERLRSVAVVSSDPNAGKTFTSIGLARSVATMEFPVVLVDGDLRRPSVHGPAGVDPAPGLGDVLSGVDPAATLQRWPGPGRLQVLAGGGAVADPAGALGGRRFREVLSQLHDFAMIVVDTPAGGLFADGLVIASQCDGAIVVVDAHRSRRRAVRRLVHDLRQVGARPIGVVFNRTDPVPRNYYQYYRAEAPVRG